MSRPWHSVELMTDASEEGWGGISFPHRAGGQWTVRLLTRLDQEEISINYLELLAVLWSLQRFTHLADQVVQLLTDSTSVISCINHQGSCVPVLMELTIELLEFCSLHNIILFPKHLAGKLNRLADMESRTYPVT